MAHHRCVANDERQRAVQLRGKSLLEREGQLDERMTRFYCACIASAFCYLHARGIAYRDLKVRTPHGSPHGPPL